MSAPLILALLWLIAANVLAILPSQDGHRLRAVCLIAVGVPLLGLVTWQHGPLIGLALLAAGASVLRWPLLFLGRWLSRQMQ
ncbi:DUF2484 family protein [Pseudoroseicyclus aestuarii]|uniref:Uncharacterized protein DUF2484 n=1 Tax=Pseudoroseicyclus aestuarii TaxID=1795041 RepID=A0A318T5E9_9RHOB|nr:DUF2484 family protein [Pseudoroseicyclus aestuarii]PYE82521.1 uncharacterized protein DUF2484 [Pseudoroseicyclus aestuarii]